jgi:hypothetical protein
LLRHTVSLALAAAGLYAVLLAATGSVELRRSHVAPVSGAPLILALELPIVEPSGDVEQQLPVASPSPVPVTDPAPPGEVEVPPPVVSPEPGAQPESTPAPAEPDASPVPGETAPVAAVPTTPGAPRPAAVAEPVAGPHDTTERAGAQGRSRRERRRPRPGARTREADRELPSASAPVPAGASPGSLSWSMPVSTIAIPDLVIGEFRIPPFLLPIYQAAGMQYGIRWEILAAINEIESDYGRNPGVSSAGARGWMQFMPSTWETYGVDANEDGRIDPYNPVDAIFAAARYLSASGGGTDIGKALFAYNHADWYVASVLERAEAISSIPSALIDSLSGLARGRFPVRARADYGAARRDRPVALGSGPDRRSIEIFARPGAPVIAVNDGRVVASGDSARRGRFVRLHDVFGNTFTYAHLGRARVAAGTRVRAGSVLARLGRTADTTTSHLLFEIRPAGAGAPRIDPEPILDGWRLLQSTALHRAERSNPFLRAGAGRPTIGQALLMSREELARRVVADADITLYDCGRSDILSGRIDRRVLATLEFLAGSALAPTVSSLRCGHSRLTASGNVSEHSTGSAVDIAAVNGVPISGHQGPGSITELTIQRLLTLQGTMEPHQIISLMTFAGADNTFAMGDHADHIHVGFRPAAGSGSGPAGDAAAVLDPGQWRTLVDRIDAIESPLLRGIPTE